MLILIHNTGQAREETLAGRPYVVAPVTLIRPGVLNGSSGPLLYPPDQIAHDHVQWNGVPLVVRHPMTENGERCSAHSPDVYNNAWTGHVFNVGIAEEDGSCYGEAWFDKEVTARRDEALPDNYKILPRLLAGKPIEVSTGLFTVNVPAPEGSEYNGTPYSAVAVNYIADHLAVLPDEEGACSLRDGCGILIGNSRGELTMRDQLIRWLTTNCSCWKGQEKALGMLSDDQLGNLKKQNVHNKVVLAVTKLGVPGIRKLVANAEGGDTTDVGGVNIADLADFLGVTVDPKNDPVGFTKELMGKLDEVRSKLAGATEPDAPTPSDAPDPNAMNKDKKDEPPTGNRKRTMNEWLSEAPPEAKDIWNSLVSNERDTKMQLIERIVGNAAEAKRPALRKTYEKMATSDLRAIAESLPSSAPSGGSGLLNPNAPLYAGAGGFTPPTFNSGNEYDEAECTLAPFSAMNLPKKA